MAVVSSAGLKARLPHSVTGNLEEKRTCLTISGVNASFNGNAYQCVVTFSSLAFQESGLANLTLEGELFYVSVYKRSLITKIFRCYL